MQSLLNNMSISVKLAFAPGVAILCLLLVGLVGLRGGQLLGASVVDIGAENLPRIVAVTALDREIRSLQIDVNKSLSWEGAGYKEAKIDALDKSITARLGTLETSIRTQAEAGADPVAKAHWDKLLADFRQYRKHAADTLDMKSGGLAAAGAFMPKLDDGFVAMTVSVDALIAQEQANAHRSVEHAEALVAENKTVVIFGFGLAVAATLAVSAFISRLISRPLADSARMARSLAGGDLTVRPAYVPSRDATGQVLTELDTVATKLTGLVTEIRQAAEAVDLASTEIAGGNTDLSIRTESTASALQQTVSSIEQLSANIRASADHASEANRLARGASEVANEGSAVVGDVVTRMESIDASARKIGEIIGVIDAIAFQTNILALNAAVEAARAGEQGRGFNVVATEVRALAKRSADSAREIRTLISASIEQIGGGVSRVRDAGDTMQRVVDAATKVSATIESISRSAAEQAAGIEQVSQAVASMDGDTQRNAALVEEASAATDSMRERARSLVALLARFRVAAA